jgi:hypothetical protein
MQLPRFTTRRLMVLVAVVSLLLAIGVGLQRRKARFKRLWLYHAGLTGPGTMASFEPFPTFYHTAKGRWHHRLSEKYKEAFLYPWLPVRPDSPPPE